MKQEETAGWTKCKQDEKDRDGWQTAATTAGIHLLCAFIIMLLFTKAMLSKEPQDLSIIC